MPSKCISWMGHIRLHTHLNRNHLNAASTDGVTYTRKEIDGLSVRSAVCARQKFYSLVGGLSA